MANSKTIAVQLRKAEGKGASRRLRHAGKVPAIVYGGGKLGPVSIQLEHKDVYLASQNEAFYSSVLDLSLDGDVQKVLLRDMQRHPFKQLILHLDFLRINADEEVRVRVPLHFINGETSPAGKTGGAIIMHEMTEIEVACLPGDLPAFIQVDLSEIKVGDTLHLSDVKLPEGVHVPQLAADREHDIAVVVARMGRVEVEPEAAEEESAEAPAAPAKKPE